MLFLSAKDVRTAVNMSDAVSLVRAAFEELASGAIVSPLRTHMPITDGGALVMPSYRGVDQSITVKVATVHRQVSATRSSSVNATIVLLDAETCRPRAIIDGTVLTALRTGAASGVATDMLSRHDASVAAIVGTGGQAYFQVAGMAAVRDLEHVVIVAQDRTSAEVLAKAIEGRLGLTAEISESTTSLRHADVISTATNAREPFLRREDVSSGTHINAIGSHRPTMSEVHPELVRDSRLIVDQRIACLAEAGDVIKAVDSGSIGVDHIAAELGEVVTGAKPGRNNSSEITLFKSVGVSAQDLAVTTFVVDRAQELGIGTTINLDGH